MIVLTAAAARDAGTATLSIVSNISQAAFCIASRSTMAAAPSETNLWNVITDDDDYPSAALENAVDARDFDSVRAILREGRIVESPMGRLQLEAMFKRLIAQKDVGAMTVLLEDAAVRGVLAATTYNIIYNLGSHLCNRAAKNKDAAMLQLLISSGADPIGTASGDPHWSPSTLCDPLHGAVQSDDVECLEIILGYVPDPQEYCAPKLAYAAEIGSAKVLEYMLRRFEIDPNMPIRGYLDGVRIWTLLDHAAMNFQPEAVKVVLRALNRGQAAAAAQGAIGEALTLTLMERLATNRLARPKLPIDAMKTIKELIVGPRDLTYGPLQRLKDSYRAVITHEVMKTMYRLGKPRGQFSANAVLLKLETLLMLLTADSSPFTAREKTTYVTYLFSKFVATAGIKHDESLLEPAGQELLLECLKLFLAYNGQPLQRAGLDGTTIVDDIDASRNLHRFTALVKDFDKRRTALAVAMDKKFIPLEIAKKILLTIRPLVPESLGDVSGGAPAPSTSSTDGPP